MLAMDRQIGMVEERKLRYDMFIDVNKPVQPRDMPEQPVLNQNPVKIGLSGCPPLSERLV